jgi:hypothetical protein
MSPTTPKTWAARVLITGVLLLAALGLAPATTVPAGAQSVPPTLSYSPAGPVVDGQTVEVTVANWPDTQLYLTQCDAAVGEGGLDAGIRYCAPDAPDTTRYTVHQTFTSVSGDTVTCGDSAGDCVLAALGPAGEPFVSVPIDVYASRLTVEPSVDLVDGQAVALAGVVPPGTRAVFAQCQLPVAATRGDSTCGPTTFADAPAFGPAEAELNVVGTYRNTLNCLPDACAVALFDQADNLVASVPLNFRTPLALTLEPDTDLVGGSEVRFTLTGYRVADVAIEQCAAAVDSAAGVHDGPCIRRQFVNGGAGFPWTWTFRVERSFTGHDGSTVACDAAPGDCVIVAAGIGSDQFVSAPISFKAQPTATLSQADELIDGQELTLSATNLVPGATYQLVYCADHLDGDPLWCQYRYELPPEEFVASEAGDATLAVTALQVAPKYANRGMYCRQQCAFGLIEKATDDVVAYAPYAMSAGALTATPDEGLSNGQPVAAATDGVQPTYDGGQRWIFTAGQWALAQCGAGVLEDPASHVGVFANCAIPPGGGVVTVPATGVLDAGVEAMGSVTPVLGGEPIDCTAEAGACVLALVRVETDFSLSLVTTPLTFGGA